MKEVTNSALAKKIRLSRTGFLLSSSSSSSSLLFKDSVLAAVLLCETQPPLYKQGLDPWELQTPVREPVARGATSRKQGKRSQSLA